MNVIKVIVDELPKGCNDCPFLVVGSRLMCIINREKVADNAYEPMPRPNWCPLIADADLLKQVASPFSKWEESED